MRALADGAPPPYRLRRSVSKDSQSAAAAKASGVTSQLRQELQRAEAAASKADEHAAAASRKAEKSTQERANAELRHVTELGQATQRISEAKLASVELAASVEQLRRDLQAVKDEAADKKRKAKVSARAFHATRRCPNHPSRMPRADRRA